MIDNFSTDFLVRPPMMSDLEAVHRLLEICDIAEYDAPDFTLEDLRTHWQGPTFNLATDAWMVVAPGDRLVGYADVQHRQHVRIYTLVRVLPEFAGQGIEENLLHLAEEWAQRQIPLAKPGARVTLFSWGSNLNNTAQNFDPTLWFLAFDGDEIAGASLCTYQMDYGWVDTLAVRRPWRRKGLGLALLHHSFGEFYRRGTYNVGLTVDSQNLTGATRLYERAGMHVARIYVSYEKELRAGIEMSTQAIPIS